MVLASLTPRMLFLADGLPGMIDVLSAAITAQPGGTVSGAAAASGAVKAQFSRQVLNARANDYSGYLQLRAAGSQAAARGNYPAAEQAYRDALDIETRLFGPDSAAVGATLLELALQVSNQQRFDEAAALFPPRHAHHRGRAQPGNPRPACLLSRARCRQSAPL